VPPQQSARVREERKRAKNETKVTKKEEKRRIKPVRATRGGRDGGKAPGCNAELCHTCE